MNNIARAMVAVQSAANQMAGETNPRRISRKEGASAPRLYTIQVPGVKKYVPLLLDWSGKQIVTHVFGDKATVAHSLEDIYACGDGLNVCYKEAVMSSKFEDQQETVPYPTPWLRRLFLGDQVSVSRWSFKFVGGDDSEPRTKMTPAITKAASGVVTIRLAVPLNVSFTKRFFGVPISATITSVEVWATGGKLLSDTAADLLLPELEWT